MPLNPSDDEVDQERVCASTVEERVKCLREYVTDDWTSSGIVLQASGRRCFTVSLAQEIQNFDSFCSGIRDRGGAVDLSLGTDSMMATVWDAGSVPNRTIKRTVGKNTFPMRVIALLMAMIAAAVVTYFSTKALA